MIVFQPSLQSLFTTPRAIQAMKFMNGLNQFVSGLSDPPALKVAVETLGFAKPTAEQELLGGQTLPPQGPPPGIAQLLQGMGG